MDEPDPNPTTIPEYFLIYMKAAIWGFACVMIAIVLWETGIWRIAVYMVKDIFGSTPVAACGRPNIFLDLWDLVRLGCLGLMFLMVSIVIGDSLSIVRWQMERLASARKKIFDEQQENLLQIESCLARLSRQLSLTDEQQNATFALAKKLNQWMAASETYLNGHQDANGRIERSLAETHAITSATLPTLREIEVVVDKLHGVLDEAEAPWADETVDDDEKDT